MGTKVTLKIFQYFIPEFPYLFEFNIELLLGITVFVISAIIALEFGDEPFLIRYHIHALHVEPPVATAILPEIN